MIERFIPTKNGIPRYRRTDQVMGEIKGWVVRHNLQPGDRLPKERELMELFQCSRGTIREALKVLEAQGFVQILPGMSGGPRIAKVSYQHASQSLRNYFYFEPLTWSQVYRVREKLEPILAVEVVEYLTEVNIAELESTLDICRAGIKGNSSSLDQRKAELDFHRILCEACPDPILRFMAGFINDLLGDFVLHRNVIEDKDSVFSETVLRDHVKLVEAYRQRDQERVEKLMKKHIHVAGCMVSEREGLIDGGFLLDTK